MAVKEGVQLNKREPEVLNHKYPEADKVIGRSDPEIEFYWRKFGPIIFLVPHIHLVSPPFLVEHKWDVCTPRQSKRSIRFYEAVPAG